MKRPESDSMTSDMESVALGTLLAGMRKLYFDTERYMRTCIEEIERRYGALNNTPYLAVGQRSGPPTKRGRPLGSRNSDASSRSMAAKLSRAARSSWADMTPEQRSVEMKRRQAVARGEAPSMRADGLTKPKLHPRDPRSPEHGKWLETMRRTQKKRWKNMPPAERTAQLKKMAAASNAARAARAKTLVNGQAHV